MYTTSHPRGSIYVYVYCIVYNACTSAYMLCIFVAVHALEHFLHTHSYSYSYTHYIYSTLSCSFFTTLPKAPTTSSSSATMSGVKRKAAGDDKKPGSGKKTASAGSTSGAKKATPAKGGKMGGRR